MLEKSHELGMEWAAVLTPGSVLKDGFFNEVRNVLRETEGNTFLYAHIKDRKERWYELHPQFFLVNLKKWNLLGKPPFNTYNNGNYALVNPSRSETNVHDDNTPWSLSPSEHRESGKVAQGYGWNWIDKSLKAGFVVKNIPYSLRNKKFYLYPEQNEEVMLGILNNLDGISRDEIFRSNLSEYQKKDLEYLLLEAKGLRSKMFLFNTEKVRSDYVEYNLPKVNAFIGLPSGFMDVHTLFRHKFEPNCQMIYYDVNPQILSFKKATFERWNGKDYPKFIEKMLTDYPETYGDQELLTSHEERVEKWQQELTLWKSPEEFSDFFYSLKTLKKDFIELNITEDSQPLIDKIGGFKDQHIALWYSNCFNYTPSIALRVWEVDKIREAGVYFLNQVHRLAHQNNLKITVYGEDLDQGVAARKFGLDIREMIS